MINSIDEELSHLRWERLTVINEKRIYYWFEPFFRESVEDFRQMFGAGLYDQLSNLAVICFLPDSVVGRRIHEGVDFLSDNGFRVISAVKVNYDFRSYNADWRFQLNDTTMERTELSHALVEMGPSLLVLLRDLNPLPGVPASVRLKCLKGASNPSLRQQHNLRDALRSVNRVLKFVHSADEPVDVIRIFGLLFNKTDRGALLSRLGEGNLSECPTWDTQQQIAALYEAFDSHDLDFEKSSKRLLGRLQDISRYPDIGSAAAAARTISILRAALGGGKFDWQNFVKYLELAGLQVGDWDVITTCSYLIKHKFDGEKSLISGEGLEDWFTLKAL